MEPDGRKRITPAKVFMSPLIGLNKLLSWILRKSLGKGYGEVTEDEIMSLVDASEESGALEEESAEMISNVFEFDDMKAGDIMTHRVNIAAVEENTNLDDVIYLALDKGFSRIPVYKGSVDKIIGIIIVKDLLCLIGDGDKHKTSSIGDFLRDVVFIPESCACLDAFRELKSKKAGMAVIIDEYGGTAGILTVEDLIEEVMGSIEDEYDEEGAEITPIGREKYEIDGGTDPEDVLELFGYELPDDHEYDTIAGFVSDLLGYIPEEAELPVYADYEDIRFVVKSIKDNFIEEVLAIRQEEKEKNKNN